MIKNTYLAHGQTIEHRHPYKEDGAAAAFVPYRVRVWYTPLRVPTSTGLAFGWGKSRS